MGKAIVSTPPGINGLDLEAGKHFALVRSATEMASAIESLLDDECSRALIERTSRRQVEESFGWNRIARLQSELYRSL
jgi:hypothetical protein